MSAPWLIVVASFLFASMGVCVKLASAHYAFGEIVFYRGLTGALLMVAFARWRRTSLATKVPAMHFWRSATGVVSLCLWFYALGDLPLATAMTLNYMSSVWMALFLIGGAIGAGAARVDGRAVAAVLLGFAGVALVLRPTIEQQQLWHGLMGLLSGMFAATAYLQVTVLGRAGEPDERIVFYFSLGSVAAGALTLLWTGLHAHTPAGAAQLLAVGAARIDGRALAAVLLGFAGVALVLRPTIDQQQLWHGLMGLLSGMFAATAYLQVTALGRAGETDDRIVFYFSLGSVGAGALTLLWTGMQPHTWAGIAELLAVGVLATVAQWMITRAYSTGRTLVNASLQYLGIAFSFAYGVLLFDDRVTLLALLGMALIVGAGLFATLLRTRGVAHDSGRAPSES